MKRAFKADIPVSERDQWEKYLADNAREVKRLIAEIETAEREIDAIVYRLFDLSKDDIALIESSIAKSRLEKQQKDFYEYKRDSHWNKGFTGGVKGGPGKWREVFDEHLNELFWKYAGTVAAKLGYPES